MMTNRRIQLWILGAIVAGAAGLQGCKESEPDPEHCWNASGNATCEQLFGFERMYCTTDAAPCGVRAEYGCVAGRPALDECYSPCGGGRSILDDSQCPEAEPADSDEEQEKVPRCGNGKKELDEECDDGNWVADDGCTNLCTLPVCGDGIVQAFRGEICDDGDPRPGDGCTATCRLPGTPLVNRVTDEFFAAHAVVVDSKRDVTVLVKRMGDSRLIKFDAEMVPQWSTEVVWSEFPSLSVSPDDDLLIGGRIGLQAIVQQISPSGDEVWQAEVERTPTSCVDVASADGYVVSTAYGDVVAQTGMLVRHDRNTGEVLSSVDWNHGPLGPVAVDGFGQAWTIGYTGANNPQLRIYGRHNNDVQLIDVPKGVYEELLVDSARDVYLLVRTPNRTSYKVTKVGSGGEIWTSKRYRNASANGMALLPGGVVVVAGHKRDQSTALLTFYDQESGKLIHELAVGSDQIPYEIFYDVAVSPTGDFGVAVGRSGESIDNSAAWIFQFET